MIATKRRGFSLLEVLLATSILLGCTIVLGHLASIGSRNARAAQDLSTAQILCETVISELLAGAMPLEPVREVPLDDQPDWLLSVELEPTDYAGLTVLRVTVAQDATESQRLRRFTLVRWIRTPNVAGTASSAANKPLPALGLPPSNRGGVGR